MNSKGQKSIKGLFKSWMLAAGLIVPLSLIAGIAMGSDTRSPARARPAKTANAEKNSVRTSKSKSGKSGKSEKVSNKPVINPADAAIDAALKMGQQGNYVDASIRISNLLKTEAREEKVMQLKYVLGLMLFEMKLYQTSSFQFVDIVRHGSNRYVRKALEKLSVAASFLNDESVLNFALSKLSLEEFPKAHQDMLFYRIGEVLRQKGEFVQAIQNFRKVSPKSTWFARARYIEGLSYAQTGKLDEALVAYQDLLDSRSEVKVTDTNRVAALLGIARIYYQKQNWEAAIEAYRQVPRDSELWHEALFELSWAYLRAAQFRSVLSNLHSLHSPFYEDHYNPESILLRSIVYLYICKYDEMEKTLDYFERAYRPIYRDVTALAQTGISPTAYFDEISRTLEQFSDLKKNKAKRNRFKVPFVVARSLLKEGDFSNSYIYVQKMFAERRRMEDLPIKWRQSSLGLQSDRNLLGRIGGAKEAGGKLVVSHLNRISKDLDLLFEQHGFARYEMLKGRKENIKKEIAAKGIVPNQVDEDSARNYYVQNGFEYWPFKGEYWLDEIGNYHYVGVQSCE